MLYQMGQLEECKQVGEDVCIQANNSNSPNYNAIAGSAKSLLSSAYKMEKDFPKAEELINSSTEVGILQSASKVPKVMTSIIITFGFSTVWGGGGGGGTEYH